MGEETNYVTILSHARMTRIPETLSIAPKKAIRSSGDARRDEGDGFESPENRLDFYAKMDAFSKTICSEGRQNLGGKP
jgi:hypothetical protein